MSELKKKLTEERRARKESLDAQQDFERQIGIDARGFARSVATRKQKAVTQARPAGDVQRASTTCGQSLKPAAQGDAKGAPNRGIPLEFYCFVDGEIGIVKVMCESDPFPL